MTNSVFFEKTSEREFDVSLSLDCLKNYIDNLGLKLHLETYGDSKFPIYKAIILDTANAEQWIGGGKGYRTQGVVSAIAECFQHYLSTNAILNYTENDLPMLSAKEILTGLNNFKKYSNIIKSDKQEKFITLPFYNICNAKDVLYYPLSLCQPRYNQLNKKVSPLTWRAHDTGSALGLSATEALLHGINEWIEKHSFSIFLVANFLSNKKTITYIDKQSLPSHIRELINHIETQFHDNLSIVLLKNEFEIPSILTYFNHQTDCIIQPKGLACSLNKQYAIEKSIFEALQSRLLRNQPAHVREKEICANYSKYPLFLNAYKLVTSHLSPEFIDYQSIKKYADMNPDEQLDLISRLLDKKGGYKIYNHNYKCNLKGLHSLQVLIPGFNESFLIKEGKFVYEKVLTSG